MRVVIDVDEDGAYELSHTADLDMQGVVSILQHLFLMLMEEEKMTKQ